jgi:uncharacterized integral membrane protein
MKRFFKAVFLFILACAVAAFAVANRHPVRFVLDPFIDRDIAYSVQAPFFVYLFIAALAGMLIGAFVMWVGQGYWRKAARTGRKEAVLWKEEAENLKRGLQAVSPGSVALPAARPLRSYI